MLNNIWNKLIKLFTNNMYKNITINLSGPICSCIECNLKWDIGSNYAKFSCLTCNIQLIVPFDKLAYHFKLDKPYPGKPETKIKKIHTNNIYPINKDNKDNKDNK